jgi:Amt family ammonium transporter
VLFFAFQMTFAIITPALIVGAYVERIGFGFVLLFSALWMLLCYAPVVHWVWGGGFLADGGIFGETGVRDFAGGIVVHETAGIAALLIAVVLGPRKNKTTPPHAPWMVMIGAAMLWVGWFGFNGGSQLAADGGAAMALTVTHISAATASLTWALWEKIKYGKASLVGMVTGTIAGLASITPASGFVGPVEALIIGAIAGILCQEAVNLIRNGLKIDDTLDVFAVHGVGGIFGTIMIAVFGAGAWAAQLGSLVIVGVFTVVVTLVLIYVVKTITPLRVDEETETNGLDLAVHGERAYDISS